MQQYTTLHCSVQLEAAHDGELHESEKLEQESAALTFLHRPCHLGRPNLDRIVFRRIRTVYQRSLTVGSRRPEPAKK